MILSTREQYEYFESVNGEKMEEAKEIITRVKNELGINFTGLKIADVGCGEGQKPNEMTKSGGTVYGVDPFESAIGWGSKEKGFIKPEQAFACFAQDLPSHLFGTFDLATMFRYRVCPRNMIPGVGDSSFYCGSDVNDIQLQVTKTLAKLIKPDGMVIIELVNNMEESYLFWPTNACTPLMYQIKKAFAEAEYTETSNRYSMFIVAKKPFDAEVIDRLKFTDVCMPETDEEFYARQEELVNLGCFYDGSKSPFEFIIDEKSKRLRCIPKIKC